jgi:hypothetical protein
MAVEKRGLEEEKAAMSQLNAELLENSRLTEQRTAAEVEDIRAAETGKTEEVKQQVNPRTPYGSRPSLLLPPGCS